MKIYALRENSYLRRYVMANKYLLQKKPRTFYKNAKTSSGNLLAEISFDTINQQPQEDYIHHISRFLYEHLQFYLLFLMTKKILDQIENIWHLHLDK